MSYLCGNTEAKKADLEAGLRIAVETAHGKAGLEAKVVRIGASEEVAWTCPMHPGVRSASQGKCPKCGMFLEKKT